MHLVRNPSVLFVLQLAVAIVALVAPGASLQASETALRSQAAAAMERSTAFMRSISTEGGYLWRYSPDLTERAGEGTATPTQIWVQPPGTPAVGMAFLRAFEATGNAQYVEAARAAAHALAQGQLESGGWDYLVEFDPKLAKNWFRRIDMGKISPAEAAKRKNVSTYDDDNTQSALRFLMAFGDAAKNTRDPRDAMIREARDYGLAKLLEAQRPAGGWPQRWNGTPVDPARYPVQPARVPADYPREHPRENYMGYYTLNDNTHRDCVLTLLEAHRRLGQPEFRAAALRGGDFIVLAQLPEPQPAWAQQYNPQLEPAWARAFEPPCICSAESAEVMSLLVDLYLESGDEKYLEPLPRAIAWFRRSELAPGVWARMYELGTNKPIYGDRDGKIKYRVEELSPERQTGYSWRGQYGVESAVKHYQQVTQTGRDAMLAKRKANEASAKTAKAKAGRAKSLEPRVRAAIEALDNQGRWLSRGRNDSEQITTGLFIANLRLLAEYVEATR